MMGLPTYALFVASLAALPFRTLVCAQTGYTPQEQYQGDAFLNSQYWTYFTDPDPTQGYVNYLSQQDAAAQGLAYAQGNAFVMAIDSTSDVPAGGNRNSVRITSKNTYNGGLFILDAAAMPIGCGMWPSFWTVGPNWPNNGEIDIVEGINNQPRNQMTLHSGTQNPCTIQSKNQFSGQLLNSNCYSTATSNAGCSIEDTSTSSFGPGFNSAGGGVFAFLWDNSKGISMWRFARNSIPNDIRGRTLLTPGSWGQPMGFWSASSCNIAANFVDHSMIFDMTICGSWAGPSYPGQSGCPGTCKEMVANSTNFANAKWVINYVDVYQPSP